jgi:hypothetical protein
MSSTERETYLERLSCGPVSPLRQPRIIHRARRASCASRALRVVGMAPAPTTRALPSPWQPCAPGAQRRREEGAPPSPRAAPRATRALATHPYHLPSAPRCGVPTLATGHDCWLLFVECGDKSVGVDRSERFCAFPRWMTGPPPPPPGHRGRVRSLVFQLPYASLTTR